jgi:NAD(P)H-hydrate epimerase
MKGDAAAMAAKWGGECRPLAARAVGKLVVDALFGAGLSRPLDGVAAQAVKAANASGAPIVAVDVPSGLHGDLGRPLDGKDSVCTHAALTITFFRKKPGHLLLPGRLLCGEILVADIGTPESVLQEIRPQTFENGPALWRDAFPWPQPEGHKYDRGHCVIVSGPAHATGAARLAARGALRIGAGLVSVASPLDAVPVNAARLTAIMVKPFSGAGGMAELLSDRRFNAVAIGPGCGVGEGTKELVLTCLASGAACVLDADAITSFVRHPNELFARTHDRVVLTPHEGEFERVFPGLLKRVGSRLEAARHAAADAKCIVLLKGPDTIVAAPDGRAAINANGPPTLATAGAGDVLTGFVAGLLAQGMPAFEAACAAVWLHGEAATAFGPGLIAEDLPEALPQALRALKATKKRAT